MRRKLVWIVALLVVAAMALPAAAAPRVSSSITGILLNAATGKPFDAGLIIVDAFNVDTLARSPIYSVGADGSYTIGPIEPGNYKVRFRIFNASSELIRYRWYDNKATFAAATLVAAPAGG